MKRSIARGRVRDWTIWPIVIVKNVHFLLNKIYSIFTKTPIDQMTNFATLSYQWLIYYGLNYYFYTFVKCPLVRLPKNNFYEENCVGTLGHFRGSNIWQIWRQKEEEKMRIFFFGTSQRFRVVIFKCHMATLQATFLLLSIKLHYDFSGLFCLISLIC